MDQLVLCCSDTDPPAVTVRPEVVPCTIRDLNALEAANHGKHVDVDLWLPMADPCPHCGGFHWTSGDCVFLGCCVQCATDDDGYFHD